MNASSLLPSNYANFISVNIQGFDPYTPPPLPRQVILLQKLRLAQKVAVYILIIAAASRVCKTYS